MKIFFIFTLNLKDYILAQLPNKINNSAFASIARSHLVDSPPTYNADYGYKSWEAYSNLSYYTRTLPPLPKDCPTPMGTAGNELTPNQSFGIPYNLPEIMET